MTEERKRGWKWSAEARAASSARLKGKALSEALRATLHAPKSASMRAKLSASRIGQTHSAKTRAKMSASHRNRPKIVKETIICAVTGCDRLSVAKGLCGTHYERARQGHDLATPIKQKLRQPIPCSVTGCDRLARKKGMCGTHYQRVRVKKKRNAI